MKYKVFGCKVNKYYTDKWLNSEYLRDKSGTFVASCVVTDNAKRKWVRFVKQELQNISGTEKIYISGCGAFKDGKAQNDFFEIYPELAHAKKQIEVLDEEPQNSPSQKNLIPKPSLLKAGESSIWEDSSFSSKIHKLKQAQSHQIYTKKFILIQWGCDSFCTFCLTVQKRGRHYFRAKEDIVEEIRDFEWQWGKEVVLTGVNLSAWGLSNTHDIQNFSPWLVKNGESWWGSRFSELLEYILENTSLPRIRISSLGPEFIDEACIKMFSHERIYPHFHFSLQSWSTSILRSMARHYDGEYLKTLLTKMRQIQREDGVDISLWADMIVGFPGETEEDFMESYHLVEEFQISKLHAFPFSAHTMWESVPAGKFWKQVSEGIKKERMKKLMKLWDRIRKDFRESQRGKLLKVLVEKSQTWTNTCPQKDGETPWSWWTENYLEVAENQFEIIAGKAKKNSIIVWKLR